MDFCKGADCAFWHSFLIPIIVLIDPFLAEEIRNGRREERDHSPVKAGGNEGGIGGL